MWELIYLYIFLFSFCASSVFVYTALRLAVRYNIVDKPDFARKIHTRSMPVLGGAGMYLAFMLTIITHIFLVHVISKFYDCLRYPVNLYIAGISSVLPKIILILVFCFILVVIGIIDDLKKLSARVKLFFQTLIALIMFFSGIRITLFIDNYIISGLITVCWIIGITNAFNLMDNMDGLSCGTAVISSTIFFIAAFMNGQFFVATILACFIGILLGFLRYNFPPAKIFMGDAGSLFIGYVLSVLTILSTYYTQSNITPAPVIMPLLIMAVPIFDTFSVIFIRVKNKVSIFTADKNHFSHRLVNLGMSTKQAVVFIYLVNFSTGIGALLLGFLNLWGCLLVLLQVCCILAIIVLLEKTKKC